MCVHHAVSIWVDLVTDLEISERAAPSRSEKLRYYANSIALFVMTVMRVLYL